MRWLAGGAAIIVLIVAGVAAWFFLPPPTNGAGWRLGPATWHEIESPDERSRVFVYRAGAEEVGIGVTVFGSSSCPPRLRAVHVGSETVLVDVRRDFLLVGACTDDLATHKFGILVQRDSLPQLPFTVIVRHAEAVEEVEVEVEVTELP